MALLSKEIKDDKLTNEQILEIIKRKNIPHKTVDIDENGNIIVDKNKDPELYDWAVNG